VYKDNHVSGTMLAVQQMKREEAKMKIIYIMPGVVAKRCQHGTQELERRKGVLQQRVLPDGELNILDL
jgi:hypothetical protein